MSNLLLHRIQSEISTHGPISFARFMDVALYDPEHGYYAQPGRVGKKGDFYTNVSVGEFFGRSLARQFAEAWHHLGEPASFLLIEQGANDGQLAADILNALRTHAPACYAATRWHGVEPHARLRDLQLETIRTHGHADKVTETGSAPVGVFYSNELIDSFPVHRVTYRNGRWHECRVNTTLSGLGWSTAELSPELTEAVQVRALPELEGYTTEIPLQITPWLHETAARLEKGYFFTFDYGLRREEYYRPDRKDGTLRGYYQHQRQDDPLQHPGQQDLTADVDFDSLLESAPAAGLINLGLTDQHHFFVGLWESALADGTFRPEDVRAFQTLIHPQHFGQRFHVLVQGKKVPVARSLCGLVHARAWV
jgi:SAM-dependent MidA family methyltransferase